MNDEGFEWKPKPESVAPPSPPLSLSSASNLAITESIREAMDHLKDRFPVWMWRNEVVLDFCKWLRTTNIDRESRGYEPPVSFLGMDIYSLFKSADEVISYLHKADPELEKIAIQNYETLGSFRPDANKYLTYVMQEKIPSQAAKVASVLKEVMKNEMKLISLLGNGDEFFNGAEVC